MKILLILLLMHLAWSVRSSKILVVFPAPAPSHYILGSALAKGLAEKGHDVTMISPFEIKNPPKNGTWRDIHLTGHVEKMQASRKDTNMFDIAETLPLVSFLFMNRIMFEMAEITLAHPNVQKLIHSGEKFDAVIVEQFVNDAHKVLATHFDAPLITFSTIGANNWFNPLVGNPSPPSYIPELMLSYSPHMTFCERLFNTLYNWFGQIFYHLHLYPKHNKIVGKYFPNSPNFYDSLYNTSIVLLNSHPSMNQPVPQVPNMIPIGGYHVQPSKKLPEDIQKFLDEAKEGVIYFSLGSNLKSAQLPIEKRDAILRVFSKLKQQVLWKWEDDSLPGKPNNVKLGKWLPQQDILAHPNVKLFITHGGLLSTTETTYHGVPVLAIPIFGDQKINARTAVNNGIGRMLPYKDLTEELLEKNLHELLNDPKYMQNAKLRSKLFHDRETKPMDTAVFWTEYVIRHRGAPHLRVAGLDLPWYKYLLLDVIAFLAILSFVSLYLQFLLVRRICRKFWNCSQINLAKKKNLKVKKQ